MEDNVYMCFEISVPVICNVLNYIFLWRRNLVKTHVETMRQTAVHVMGNKWQ